MGSPSKKRRLNDVPDDEDSDMDNDSTPNNGKHKGTVKWFNQDKGFGFIANDDGSDDLFVHQKDLHCEGYRSLVAGEAVEFEIEKEKDEKLKAIKVTGPNGAYCLGEACYAYKKLKKINKEKEKKKKQMRRLAARAKEKEKREKEKEKKQKEVVRRRKKRRSQKKEEVKDN